MKEYKLNWVVGIIIWIISLIPAIAEITPDDDPVIKNKPSEAQLPRPVEAYLRQAIIDSNMSASQGQLRQVGQIRIDPTSNTWYNFTAEQSFDLSEPGFEWNATISMAPLLKMRIRDTYYDASATMKGKLARLLTIIDESDKPELDQGALQRYLAETVWFPQALLQLQNLEWTAVDDSTALATLTDGSNPVSLHFHFDANDLVKAVSTESRYREVNGEYIPTPWRGEFSDYREVAGMLVPKKAQIIWVIDGTDVVTWRADIVSYDTSIPVD